MLVFALAIFVALIAVIVYKMFLTSEMCTCNNKMTGKVVLVTGANTGIGFETAKDLARRGAKVIIACRDKAKGLAARDEIINATRNKTVILKEVDLSSLSSVRAFAEDILKTEPKLHVLINNAGAGRLDNSLTEDNIAVEPQINHFSPFLLTVLLLPLLKSSAPSRIVNVSSIMHNRAKFNLETFAKPAENDKEFGFVYANCKLANILFTLKLSRMLQGSGVTANSLHPGAVSTNIFRNKNIFSRMIVKLLFMTPIEGAQTSIHLAVAPELTRVSGKYFAKCSEVTPAKIARDYALAEGLWELSERLVLDKKSQ